MVMGRLAIPSHYIASLYSVCHTPNFSEADGLEPFLKSLSWEKARSQRTSEFMSNASRNVEGFGKA